MARDARRGPSRNGPGRSTPRVRAVSRTHARSSASAGVTPPQRRSTEAEPTPEQPKLSFAASGLGITRRAVALIVVVAVLVLSYATSLRVWFNQQGEIAATQADIRERQERIAQLEDELDRWNDPEYVKTQARERLGWVVPGETGYRVVGPDGEPLGGAGELGGRSDDTAPPQEAAWWGQLFGSVQAVDQPVPAAEAQAAEGGETPSAPHTVGPTSEPTP